MRQAQGHEWTVPRAEGAVRAAGTRVCGRRVPRNRCCGCAWLLLTALPRVCNCRRCCRVVVGTPPLQEAELARLHTAATAAAAGPAPHSPAPTASRACASTSPMPEAGTPVEEVRRSRRALAARTQELEAKLEALQAANIRSPRVRGHCLHKRCAPRRAKQPICGWRAVFPCLTSGADVVAVVGCVCWVGDCSLHHVLGRRLALVTALPRGEPLL